MEQNKGKQKGNKNRCESNIKASFFKTIYRTLGFTYLKHVYSDTVFFLGNFSKNFLVSQPLYLL